jgi:hypothetical protein
MPLRNLFDITTPDVFVEYRMEFWYNTLYNG